MIESLCPMTMTLPHQDARDGELRTDRRSSRRRSVFLRAKVKLPAIPTPVNCVVRNISPMGALIHFEKPTPVPERFKLVIEADFFEAECEVRHVSGEMVGVEFVTSRLEALARYS